MIDFSETTEQKPASNKWAFSLIHVMVISFTALAFIPLAMLMLLSYPKIQEGFNASIENELIDISLISKNSMKKWFDELTYSVVHEAQVETTIQLITDLTNNYNNSDLTLENYVTSDRWHQLTQQHHDYYLHFSSMHDDFYDIFIIDDTGNILYSLANESDLGTNLNNGILKNSLFSQTYQNVMSSSSTHFSDLEYYEPSDNTVSGFIISPIINNQREKIGAFALQINFETAINFNPESRHKSLVNYVINKDLLLRNKMQDIKHGDILSTRVSNDLTNSWNNSTTLANFDINTNYNGLISNEAIGVYHTLDLIDKKWAIIYEIDRNEVYASVIELKNTYIITLIFCVLITLFCSYFLAKKISNPIRKLSDLTKIISSGEDIDLVEHKGFKETHELASNFNKMINQQTIYENALEENRKIAVTTLKELENIQFAMNQHSIISITDIKGNIIFCNDKFSEISGFSFQELNGNNHRIVNSNYHDPNFWRDMYLKISKGNTWHGEIKNIGKNNNIYWVQSTIVPILDTNHKVERYISLRTDITDSKLAEIEIIKAKEMAEAAAIAKSEFLASMSHEIRTPMNGILGMLNILQKTSLDGNQTHKVGLAKNSAKSLLTIINDILDFSKIEAGKLDIEKIEFDIIQLLGDVSESIALNAQDKNIEVILDYSEIHQKKFIGDPSRIKQILFNLAGNAVKFTTKGSITISAKIKKSTGKGYIFTCNIVDTGIGISQDKLPLLFEKFTQADNSTTREYGGTGLGLAIVKQLVNLMNGELLATSEIGIGSCFSFNISIEGEDRSESFKRQINQYPHTSILIIDSFEKSRNNLMLQFSKFNTEVISIESLEQYQLSSSINNESTSHSKDINIVIIDEEQISNQALYDDLYLEFKNKSVKLIIMTKLKNKLKVSNKYQYSFPKPAIFQDIITCLDTINSTEDKLTTVNINPEQLEPTTHNMNSFQYNILLVEDNFVNQQVALSLLEELNCIIEIAENGQESIDKLNEKPDHYDLILMDCQMPIMDGYTAAHQIRLGKAGESYTQTPIIALTANAMKGDKEKCLAAGMDDYLTKPIEQQILSDKLDSYLKPTF